MYVCMYVYARTYTCVCMYVPVSFVRMPGGLPKGLKEIGKGYCTDYLYPSTGTRSGAYDNLSDDAQGCMYRCLAINTDMTAFFLKGTWCGCSATTTGPCKITSSLGYEAYEITGTICLISLHVFVSDVFDATWCSFHAGCIYVCMYACMLARYLFMPGLSKTFKEIGKGHCTDWRYASTGTQTGGYDDISTNAQACMYRCLALNADITAFYLKGTQCGCSTTTSGPCKLHSQSGYRAFEITGNAGTP